MSEVHSVPAFEAAAHNSLNADPDSTPDNSDGALIRRLRTDDLTALGVLFERYRAQVYRTAYAITRDTAAADDILQDSLLKVYSYAQRLDENAPLMPWLYRVTVNLSYTWVTRHNRRWLSIEDVVEKLVSPLRTMPEPSAESNETRRQLQKAIDALPINQRLVVILHYMEELDLPEIAEILSIPVGTVKSRLHYARESLRQQLHGLAWEGEQLFNV